MAMWMRSWSHLHWGHRIRGAGGVFILRSGIRRLPSSLGVLTGILAHEGRFSRKSSGRQGNELRGGSEPHCKILWSNHGFCATGPRLRQKPVRTPRVLAAAKPASADSGKVAALPGALLIFHSASRFSPGSGVLRQRPVKGAGTGKGVSRGVGKLKPWDQCRKRRMPCPRDAAAFPGLKTETAGFEAKAPLRARCCAERDFAGCWQVLPGRTGVIRRKSLYRAGVRPPDPVCPEWLSEARRRLSWLPLERDGVLPSADAGSGDADAADAGVRPRHRSTSGCSTSGLQRSLLPNRCGGGV